IILRNKQKNRVIDCIDFGPQANGISMGRYPDGAPEIKSLQRPTPALANARVLVPDIVINEIMYKSVSRNSDEDYVELFNRSTRAINLNGWRLEGGIGFTFTSSFTLNPGAYLVVAKNLDLLRTNNPGTLTTANSVGNFSGNLSSNGERIALSRPEAIVSTNSNGKAVTNISYVVVNEVRYYSGGQWPQWADGGGSSMELIDPNSDNSLPSNWADSNESGKSAWTTVERRGILDNGSTNFPPTNPSRNLHVLLLDGGEALMDNISVIPDGGTNIVKNPGLEAGMTGWLAIGTHDETTIDPGAGPDGSAALHIRAAERGDTAGNRIRAQLTQPLTNGSIVTLKADVKWLHGTPEFLLRVHGNYLELPGVMTVPKNLGSPGAPNSVLRPNSGPSIVRVSPSPVLPMANQNVTISAQITDPDQIALATLYYRVDPGTNYSSVTMTYNGAGFYSASLPGQSNGVMVAFYIEALDSRGATTRFPADAPEKEGLILFGDSLLSGNFSTYRVWMSDNNIQRWNQRVQSSNKNLDATFVYNNERVVYDMGTKYSGSPFHWLGYDGPLGKSANYSLTFPSDDLFLGQSDFVLNLPSNIASDGTGVREQVFFWMASQVNQPYNYRRYTHFVLNGFDRDVVGGTPSIYEDAQQPNNDMVEEWFPNDPDGDLFKIEDWFEFTDSFQMFNQDSELKAVITTNLVTGLPEYKKERYRWWFRKRAVNDSAHDYSELFRLISAVNNPDPAIFVAQTEALVDIDEWMGAIALRHAAGDWDSFGYRRGKNMYAYKPQNGKWNLMHWDVAFAFGLGDGTTADQFDTVHFDGSGDTITKRMIETAPFRRAYFRALYNIVNGPFIASRVGPIIDAKYNALISNGVPASSPQSVKDWIENRRQAILAQLASVSAGFTITSNSGNNYSTNRNTVVLSGTAPVNVKSIRINGVEYPLTWTSVNTWQATVA
ncbi:MAG: CotH kinase family protein, partial [Verrucomicrobiota bacterium]